MPSYQYLVTLEVERESGKFAGRDEIEEALTAALEEAANDVGLDGLGADGDSVYFVSDCSVETYTPPKAKAGGKAV